MVRGTRTNMSATEGLELPGFKGELIYPESDGYDDARAVFNGMIDRYPALIARCADADDVAAAVRLAAIGGLELSVYGGGHGVTGSAVCDAGIVVDLRALKGIDVDPAAKTVRAEGGVTWGEFDAATQEHGLAVTGGRMSTTGIAGLTLGSGSGWLERKCGFVCDNLIKAEVVTACRRAGRRVRDREPRSVLGVARWRRQLRHRDRVPPPAARDRPDGLRRHAHVPRGDGSRPPALLPRLHAERTRRGLRRARVRDRAARGLRARAGPRPARHRRSSACTPVRSRTAEEAFRPLVRVRSAGDRHDRPDAVRRAPAAAGRRRTRTGCRTTGPRTSSPSCPTRPSIRSSTRHQAGVADDERHPRPGWRRRGAGRRRGDRVRTAQRAVERPLPLDVGGPGRHRRATSRTPASSPTR